MIVTTPVLRGALTLALILGAASAMAQGVGGIGGTATDASGAVLPGVSVTLTAIAGGVGSGQSTVTNEQGAYQFTRLVPGIYAVKSELQGFRPRELQKIEVNSDQVSRADLRLEIGSLEEDVTVTSSVPLLDTSTALKQTVISRETLQALPNRSDVWSIARVIPGVTMDKIDVGGTEQFLNSVTTVHGSSTENKFTIDGMDVSYVGGNSTVATMYLDPFAFEETNFMMGAGSAESSNGGLTFNVVTRSGTNQLHGGGIYNGTFGALAGARNFDASLRSQLIAGVPARALAANPDIIPNADIETMYDVGGWLGGPLLRDRLWFAGTWHDQRYDAFKLGSYNPDGTQVINDNLMRTATAKLTWQMTRTAQLSYFFNVQYKLIGHRGGGTFADSRARQYNYKYPTVHQAKYTTPIKTNKVFDLAYNRFRADDVFGSRPEVKPGDIATNDTTTQVSEVALPTYNANNMRRDQVRTSLSWLHGRHNIKGGYDYVNAAFPNRAWSTSGLRANFANGVPTSVNTYLIPVTQVDTSYGADIPELYRFESTEHGLYLQDRFSYRRLVLNLGVRYETNQSVEPATCRPDTSWFPGQCYDKVTGPAFHDVLPRFNAVYDLRGDGRTAIKFAANRYSQPLGITVIQNLNPVSIVSDQRSWNDSNKDGLPQLSEIGPSPGYVFPGASSRYEDGFARPVSNEYTIEVQRQLPSNIVVSAGYTYKQSRRNIVQTDTTQTLASWGAPIPVQEVTSGEPVQVWRRGTSQSALLFYNSPDADVNYRGGDVTVNKRMSNHWSLIAGGAWGKTITNTRGGVRSDPHVLNYFDSDVLAIGDIPWSYRLSGVYELPYQISASGTWQYQAGVPQDTTVLVTNATITLPQGNQLLRVRDFGAARFPNTAQLDLSVRRTFRFASRSLVPRIDIFNSTNQSTVNALVTQLGPTYGRISGIQQARLVKVGLSVEF